MLKLLRTLKQWSQAAMVSVALLIPLAVILLTVLLVTLYEAIADFIKWSRGFLEEVSATYAWIWDNQE